MDESMGLSQFQFLRPWWLMVVPLAVFLHFRSRQAYDAAAQWSGAIDAHLLRHLTVLRGQKKRLRPFNLLTAVLILGSVALAGPAWERVLTPFTEDRSPLVVALKLTPSMLSIDHLPTRLERAKQKLRDILERRRGARTAVIGYAGSAHAILPLTDDVQLIEIYLESLSPAIMPKEGDDPVAALELANQLLSNEDTAGTILFMTDGIDRSFAEPLAEQQSGKKDKLLFLAFGTAAGGPIKQEEAGGARHGVADTLAPGVDLSGLEAVSAAVDGQVVEATADTRDVDRLMQQIRTNLVNAIQADKNLQWRDFGYFLVWPLALLCLFWWRRGWTINWV